MATFRTRTGRHGDKTVQVMVRRAGFPTLTETFPTRREAEKWAAIQEAGIIEGKVSKDALGRKRTLKEACERFQKEVQPLLRNGSMYGFTLDWWIAKHGDKKLGEVSRGWLAEARSQLLTGTFTRRVPKSQGLRMGKERSIIARVRESMKEGAAVEFTHGFSHPDGPLPGLVVKGSVYKHADDYSQPQGHARTPATCNRYMAALSAVFSQVCGDWEWLQPTANPFVGFAKLPEGRNKGRAYADEARARLLVETAKDPQLHTLVQVALGTAARAGELLALTWSHVELGEKEGRLMFADTKNGEARIAWLFGDALKAMKAHRAHRFTGDYGLPEMLGRPVFPGQWSHMHQRYGKYDYLPRLHAALERAGLKMSRPFHALRHTAATTLASSGANAHQLKALGGWKSDAVNRYVHLAGQDSKALTQQLAEKLAGKQENK